MSSKSAERAVAVEPSVRHPMHQRSPVSGVPSTYAMSHVPGSAPADGQTRMFVHFPTLREATTEEAPHFARPTWAIMALVCVTLSAMLLEGAGADWSAIYMRDVFAASPLVCGLAVAAVRKAPVDSHR